MDLCDPYLLQFIFLSNYHCEQPFIIRFFCHMKVSFSCKLNAEFLGQRDRYAQIAWENFCKSTGTIKGKSILTTHVTYIRTNLVYPVP